MLMSTATIEDSVWVDVTGDRGSGGPDSDTKLKIHALKRVEADPAVVVKDMRKHAVDAVQAVLQCEQEIARTTNEEVLPGLKARLFAARKELLMLFVTICGKLDNVDGAKERVASLTMDQEAAAQADAGLAGLFIEVNEVLAHARARSSLSVANAA